MKIAQFFRFHWKKFVLQLHIFNILLYSSKIQISFFFLWLIKFHWLFSEPIRSQFKGMIIFTTVLTGGFSLKYYLKYVYLFHPVMWWSRWSQRSYLPFIQSLLQVLGKPSEYNWYHSHLHVQQLFQLSAKILVFVQIFTFFSFQFIFESGVTGSSHYIIQCLLYFSSHLFLKFNFLSSFCLFISFGILCWSVYFRKYYHSSRVN